MKVGNAIAEILKREGVSFLVGYPVNPLFEAAAEVDIRTIVVRQERNGLHMADAFSRLSSGERFGVFAMQHGPGAENAFGAVAQAFGDSVPVLVLPAGYPRRVANVPPNFNAALNYRHVTKWAEPVWSGRAVPEILRRAFGQLRNGRPGPVLVEIPLDVFGEDVPEPLDYTPGPRARSAPDPDAVREVAAVLAEAQRPVLYAGQGVHYAQAWGELRSLAERLSIPVTTSLQGKSAFPEDHPLSLGSGGRSMPETVHRFLQDADVILGIGCSFALTAFGVRIPRGKVIVHATVDPGEIDKDVRAQHALVGDARLTLRALLAELDGRKSPAAEERSRSVPRRIAETREAWLGRWMPKLTSDEVPLSPYRVIRELMQTVDVDETIITHDAGSPRDQLSPFWPSRVPLSYIGWGKTTQLGYGLGLAMGAKLARPDKLCINVWGDAAIGMTGLDFETAVRERIPILSILMNNFSMAIEVPIMPGTTQSSRRHSAATASASPNRARSSARSAAASRRTGKECPRCSSSSPARRSSTRSSEGVVRARTLPGSRGDRGSRGRRGHARGRRGDLPGTPSARGGRAPLRGYAPLGGPARHRLARREQHDPDLRRAHPGRGDQPRARDADRP
jgi:acetolactate synthase-1/2/3 large subunit